MNTLLRLASLCHASRKQVASHTKLKLELFCSVSTKVILGLVRQPYSIITSKECLREMPCLDARNLVIKEWDDGPIFIKEIASKFPHLECLIVEGGHIQWSPDVVLPNLTHFCCDFATVDTLDLRAVAPNLTTLEMGPVEHEGVEVILPDEMNRLYVFVDGAVTRGKHINLVEFLGMEWNQGVLECERINLLRLSGACCGIIKNCVIKTIELVQQKKRDYVLEFIGTHVDSLTVNIAVSMISLDGTRLQYTKEGHLFLPLSSVDDLVAVDPSLATPLGTSLIIKVGPKETQCNFAVKRLHVCPCILPRIHVDAQETIFYTCASCTSTQK